MSHKTTIDPLPAVLSSPAASYLLRLLLVAIFLVSLTPRLAAQSSSNVSASGDGGAVVDVPEATKPKESARRTYLGRIVAQPMSHLGASWLIRPQREQEESVRESFDQLELKPGMTVCDLGCGNGFWTLPMARAVGEEGRVLAVDIQPQMLQKLRARAAKAGLENVIPIRGDVDDPNLESQPNLTAGAVDLLLMVDVYHEFSHPESMLWSIRRSLKPTGVVALLEYRAEDPEVPIKPLHKMSKQQIMKEYQKNGLKLVREYNGLPWQHLMFFARDDSLLQEIEPLPTAEVLKNLQ